MSQLTQPYIPAYAPVTPLRAGPITLLFSNGDLRQLRVGEVEIVQRIYVAVRDQDWGTAPATLHDLVIDDHLDRFRITFTAVHRENEVGFTWRGQIDGSADGTVRFTMDGRADTTFKRNRIGFCVLHPASAAGTPVTLTHSDGSQSASEFPTLVSPHQPFMDLRAITHEFAPGQYAEVSFEGDIFETEDQRNWTDASYKTYSTPLSLPFPVTVEAGTTIRQEVTVRVHGNLPQPMGQAGSAPVAVNIEQSTVATLPQLGLGCASHGQPLSAQEAAHIAALKLSHLRVDLDLSQPDVGETLARAVSDANAVGAALEIALFVGEDVAREIDTLEQLLAATSPNVARWLVFARHAAITPAATVTALRPTLARFAPDAPIGGGTNLYFVHLNRTHPPVEVLDFVCYSINPQVHAFDLVSLVENMTAQPATVVSARAFVGDKPIVISPITLRARFNADAAGPPAPTPPGELPYSGDVRQPTGFAAAWTLGSLSNLAQAGVAALTYYETTGWRGVLETEAGTPLPDKFPSQPGQLFPVYHLFHALAPYAGGEVHRVTISDPLTIAAIAVTRAGQHCTIVANLRDTTQQVAIQGHHGALALQTLGDPAGSIAFDHAQGSLTIELAPYALVKITHPE